ncbi:hypothetical protein [Cobetia sp. L2A1]|uniref:hypothetical protein n=1 Tax=Cobetia sp. L2A1 TaxID=2686360 RepID=UPI00131D26B7|nr:hypothetical protein [Cobetia sp. L2A1]
MPEPHDSHDSANDSAPDDTQASRNSAHADETTTSSTPTTKPRRDTRQRNRLFWLLLIAALITGFWLV